MNKFKLVIWDLDNTLWDGILAEGDVVLNESIAEFIKELNARGIVNSICSKNEYSVAQKKLVDFGLWEYFVFPIIDFLPKGEAIATIIKDMSLRAENVLFVDDSFSNLEEAKFYNAGITTFYPEEVAKELFNRDEFSGFPDGEIKLKQYRQLENKTIQKKHYSSNEDFLYASNILVEFIEFDDSYFERIAELVEKTNQLNFTKNRMKETELRSLLSDQTVKTKLIRVVDDFGDYGIVGFYSLRENELVHFVFSCRIMNMGVERYVYMTIGKPMVKIQGEVAASLEGEFPRWINRVGDITTDCCVNDMETIFKLINKRNMINVFGIGACDLLHSISYFRGASINLTYECNEFKGIERAVNTGTEYIRSTFDMDDDQKAFCKSHFYNYINAFNGTGLFNKDNDVIILSFHDDMVFKIFSNTNNKTMRVIRTDNPAFGLTSIIEGGKIIPHNEEKAWLINNGFDKGEFITPERFRDNLLWIKQNAPHKRFYLINGPEYPYFRDYLTRCPEVEGQIKIINGVLNSICHEFPDTFVLVDINEIVKSREDFTDYIFHLTAQSSYRLYRMILREMICREDFSDRSFLNKKVAGRKICLIGDGVAAIDLAEKLRLYKTNVDYTISLGNEKEIEEMIPSCYTIILGRLTKSIRRQLVNKTRRPLDDYVIVDMRSHLEEDMNEKKQISASHSNDTWSNCKKAIDNRKFVAWGIGRGEGLRIVDKRIGLKRMVGAIDRDPCVQGANVGLFLDREDAGLQHIIITDPSKIDVYTDENLVIIITGMGSSEDIRKSIFEQCGQNRVVFSVKDMELNKDNGME